ncbi:MAG: GNAT family N-acetyltransferase [Alphaproteobacteria bacterium]
MITIAIDDPDRPDMRALLEAHLAFARGHSPEGSGHALDVDALKAPDMTLWSAREGADLLGCAALKELAPTHGELKSMHTRLSHRGRGVARALVAHVIDEARRRGYTRLSLETGKSEDFAPAQMLYAALGFTPCPPFGPYLGDPFSYCMTRDV